MSPYRQPDRPRETPIKKRRFREPFRVRDADIATGLFAASMVSGGIAITARILLYMREGR